MAHLFVWDQSKYGLDIGPMDDEHKQIISCMNTLHELHEAKAPRPKQGVALASLAAITIKHFADEEAYMTKIGFPDLAKHKTIHASLLAQISDYKKQFESGADLPEAFFSFLAFWLRSHICGIDMKYSKFAKQA